MSNLSREGAKKCLHLNIMDFGTVSKEPQALLMVLIAMIHTHTYTLVLIFKGNFIPVIII